MGELGEENREQLIKEDHANRDTTNQHGGKLGGKTKEGFERMMAQTRSHVHMPVGMVNNVESPEGRKTVLDAMNQVTPEKIQEEYAAYHMEPHGQLNEI